MAGNGYKGLESCSYLSKMLKMAPRVEYVSLESQFRGTAWAFSASKITLKNIKHVRNVLKEKVILTKDVSLSCIDFQLWVEETL